MGVVSLTAVVRNTPHPFVQSDAACEVRGYSQVLTEVLGIERRFI